MNESPCYIKSLPLPEKIQQFYIDSGIKQLYPPQGEVVQKGLLEGKNTLAAIPTASGKTLLAELAMLKHVIDGGKALYIVPLIALANEKYHRFKEFEKFGILTGISTGELESKSEGLGKNDIIVCTSEKTDSMLRNGTQWLQTLSIVVVDEVHLLDEKTRGPTLEIVMTKLRKIPNLQIVALSATIGNTQVLADWLKAELTVSDWRPTKLQEGVVFGKAMNFLSEDPVIQKEIVHDTKESAADVALDTIKEGGQCLVFESSRRTCMAFAKRFSNPKKKEHKQINILLSQDEKNKLAEISEEIEYASDTTESNNLAECIRNGVAFHHAGLNAAQRRLVEDGFKENKIKVISCTPTLAAGLNLPARRVVIRSFLRYDANEGNIPIPVLDYKQMVGRAGRPHLDPYGQSLLIAKSSDQIDFLETKYIHAKAEDIYSKLGSEKALRSHILAIISSGLATSQKGVIDFLSETFYAHTSDLSYFIETINECLYFLEENDLIVTNNNHLQATPLGQLVSRMYIDPLTAVTIVEDLKKASQSNMELTAFSLLQVICKTPDIRTLYLKGDEYFENLIYADDHKNEIINFPDLDEISEISAESFIESIKNARILLDWIEECETKEIVENYVIGEGDLHSLSESASWISHAVQRISKLKGFDIQNIFLEQRLKYGASKELVSLLSIKNIGRKRARKLYDNGIGSADKIKSTPFSEVSKLFGNKITIKIFHELELPIPSDEIDTSPEVPENNKKEINQQKNLFDF